MQKICLGQNEAAVSIAVCKFANQNDQAFILVGVAQDLQLNPRQARGGGEIHTYAIINDGQRIELLHKVW